MGQATNSRFTGLSASNARAALLGGVSLVVVVVAVALVLTGVTSGEVAATLLFLPVFAAGFLGGRKVGYAGAVVAVLVYLALRRSDLSSAGAANAGVLALTRAGAYLVVGHVGALAQALVPDGDGETRDAPPGRRPPRTAQARPAGRATAAPAGAQQGPRWDQPWDQPWEDETGEVPGSDRREPVLAGVGSAAGGGPRGDDERRNGAVPTTMSGAWPPEPPPEPWRGDGPSPRGGRDGRDTGGWDDSGSGWHGGESWPGEGTGEHTRPHWPGGDEERPVEDTSWEAVQQTWRQQHGVPVEDDAGEHTDTGADRGWPGNGMPDAEAWDGTAPQAWNDPPGRNGGHEPGRGPGRDPWASASPAEAPWGREPTAAGPPPDPWADAAPTGGTWAPGDADGGWPAAAPEADDRWAAAPGTNGDGWSAGTTPPTDAWQPPAPANGQDDVWGGLSGDAWPQSGSPSGGWSDGPSGHAAGGWNEQPPADAAGGWSDAPSGPATAGWNQQPSGEVAGGWRDAPPGPATGGWNDAPSGPATGGWNEQPSADATGGWNDVPSGPATGGWNDAMPHDATGGWAESPSGPATGGWSEQPPDDAPRGWDDAPQGRGDGAWDGAPAAHDGVAEHWSTGAPTASPAWPPAGAFDTSGGPGTTGGHAAVSSPEPAPSLPAVDPETGLWTAKFLRDRLASERARSRRGGHPFSLVLVQVPDGPLAQLPYRRQLTLLRELGYQFVAGGVVDHLVHVPDQAQHWFAVILPDTDRSGAQVLERRLRLGIGGYLSSRGLRLRELESASLTAPDDDPAMGVIWEGLIGPDEGGSSSPGFGY